MPGHAERLQAMVLALEENLQGQVTRRIGDALGTGGEALQALRDIGYVGDDGVEDDAVEGDGVEDDSGQEDDGRDDTEYPR